MTAPLVRGWCPGAHRPMLSGDGLVVRVKPRLGRLTAEEALSLALLAQAWGNGMIDVTSRANLQIRGVKEDSHGPLLGALIEAGLVDADPVTDARRAIVAASGWVEGDLTDRLGKALETRLADLPAMPAKVGFILDTGPLRMLDGVSGDFRFEIGPDGLILRADGAPLGRPVTEGGAIDALVEMAHWFVETGGGESGRMRRHLAVAELPPDWSCVAPGAAGPRPEAGASDGKMTVGVPFGQLAASDLAALVETGCETMDITPWRLIRLNYSLHSTDKKRKNFPASFVISPGDPVLAARACPGAPLCPQATVETRDLARRLAGQLRGLHVSGCSKGCAHPAAAWMTVVGCGGLYDVVRDGRASDPPEVRGLTAAQVLERFGA